MFCGGIRAHGLTPLVRINSKMNSTKYQELLRDYMLPVAEDISCGNFVFQQDGASCHKSASTKQW